MSDVIVGMYTFVSPEPERLASFWGELMGLPVSDDGAGETWFLDLHHEVAPVTWIIARGEAGPAGERFWLDIGNQDAETWTTVADRAERLSATRVSKHDDDGFQTIVMTDPDGNRFRVVGARPD